jgi:hypothetical protein
VLKANPEKAAILLLFCRNNRYKKHLCSNQGIPGLRDAAGSSSIAPSFASLLHETCFPKDKTLPIPQITRILRN